MKITMTKLLALLAPLAFAASAVLATPAQAGGSLSIPLPPLPPIPHFKLPAPPLMVWLPTPAVHVALDSPYPIFHHENRYYLHSNNAWYVGPGYQGPWASVHVHLLPLGLRHYRGHEWDHYQQEARYQRHHEDRAHPHFYGHRMHERRDARDAHGNWDDSRPRYEPRHRVHNSMPVRHRPVERREGRHFSHNDGSGHAYNRGHNMARAQIRNEGHKHNNGRWRANY